MTIARARKSSKNPVETLSCSEKPASKVHAHRNREAVCISSEALADAARVSTRREMVDRLFSISDLRALRIDPVSGTAWLSFHSTEITVPEALEAMAAAFHAPTPPRLALPNERLLTKSAQRAFEVRRAEHGLTFWNVEELNPGRFLLSHPMLRNRFIRERALDAISAVAGVKEQTASLFRRGSIEVRCHPHRVTAGILLEVVEPLISEKSRGLEIEHLPVREGLVTANLALAPISDFLFPPLGIANACLVSVLNAEHILPALAGLRQRRFNLALLYLSVGVLTLLSFSFFAASVMYAALEFWPALVRRLRIAGERQFLSRYRRRPRRVWIERDETLLETPLADLPTGGIVVLREGDTVPGDGVVVDGAAEVSESWISGATDLTGKRSGDPVFASTELRQGEIRMRVDTIGGQTMASRLASWFTQALYEPSVKRKSETLADSVVFPALILGLAALGRGGIPMAKAVLRPDYFTGPAVAEDLGDLITIIQAAEVGIYIAEQSLLDRLLGCDCWIFDDSVPWRSWRNEGSSFAERMRSQGVREVYFLSRRSVSEASTLAMDLGFDLHHANSSTEAAKGFVAERQSLGQNVAYFGNCTRNAIVAEQANVAISVLDTHNLMIPAARAALLVPDLARCSALYSLSQARVSGVTSAFVTSAIPNVIAIAGAFYLNFSVLTSVILTNVGTLASYYRWRGRLLSAQ